MIEKSRAPAKICVSGMSRSSRTSTRKLDIALYHSADSSDDDVGSSGASVELMPAHVLANIFRSLALVDVQTVAVCCRKWSHIVSHYHTIWKTRMMHLKVDGEPFPEQTAVDQVLTTSLVCTAVAVDLSP
jgi:hypothetical protein